jgi:glyoxylase-like metal-dependent hydrolase (beta-lactamase superfamily II)
MKHHIPLDPRNRADQPQRDAERDDRTHEVAKDVAYQRLGIVNVVYLGRPGARDREWVLVDTGVMGTTGMILKAVRDRFGLARPGAIIQTHGHFDHVGGLEELVEKWDVPIYAQEREHPYLDGSSSYPPPDPSVGGGLFSFFSRFYPRGPINVGYYLEALPQDGTVPLLKGWRWIHTPGHTPGHISLWRESDRMLLAGDAFITTTQESAYAVALQRTEMHGPPMYYTQDWKSAQASVERLAALEPEVAVTGHGRAMKGAGMRVALHMLARDFVTIAVPKRGKYVDRPARVESGTAYVAP